MKFKLADDVRKQLERLARRTKRDPNDILRELLRKEHEEFWTLLGGKPDKPVIPPQRFLTPPPGPGERPAWGRIVMKPKSRTKD